MGVLKESNVAPLGRVVLAHEPSFTLGAVKVIPATRQVEGAGRSETIEPRVMQVLVALARAEGAIVTRDELIDCCWDGRIVTDDAINRPLAQIRHIAADIGDASFKVETITKVGYRLLEQPDNGEGEPVRQTDVPSAEPEMSRRAAIAGFGVIGIAAAATGGWLLLKPGATNSRRIAVMPFANLSGDAGQAYFAEGVAEELRSALSRIGMEVIGRSSSVSVKDLDTRAAAKKLGVEHILTGSVRRSAGTIRVSAQLISGKDGVARWGQSYDRAPGDVIKIQTDIATNVAQALQIVLGRAGQLALTLGGTTDSIAQDLFLQARELRRSSVTIEDLLKSLALAEAAIARDANYAMPLVEKATLLIILSMNYSNSAKQMIERIELAEAAGKRALAIAPTLGLAHPAMFGVEQARINFALALQHLRRALALAPDEPDILFFGPGVLAQIGDGREAIRLADRLITLDPLNARSYRSKTGVLAVLGRYREANDLVFKILEMEPDATFMHLAAAYNWMMMGRLKEAQAALRLSPVDNPSYLTLSALIAARSGDIAGAKKWASALKKQYGFYNYQQAQIHAQLGQKEQAFAELDKALSIRDNSLMGLRLDPFMKPLHDDPRFAALVAKLHFPS